MRHEVLEKAVGTTWGKPKAIFGFFEPRWSFLTDPTSVIQIRAIPTRGGPFCWKMAVFFA